MDFLKGKMSWYGRGRLDYHLLKFIELSFLVSPRDYFNPLCQTGSGTPPL